MKAPRQQQNRRFHKFSQSKVVFHPNNIVHFNRRRILTGGEGSHPGTETEVSHFIAEKHQLHQEEKQLERRGQKQPPHSDVCPLIISTLQRL